jgi:hypothetical protein
MAPQIQHEIIVRFLDRTERKCVRTGNNAAWHCQCGRPLPLIGYSDGIDSANQNSLVICPEPSCGKRFRVVAPGLMQVPTHVQEVPD